jgi:hypothetical protein
VSVNGRRLGDHYPALEPQERFQAALEAATREDYDERRRLVDSCPRRTYTMSDTAFLDRVDASRDLALGVALAIAPELAQVRVLAVVSELTAQTLAATMACHVLADARREADPDAVLADFDAVLAEELPKAQDTSVYHAIETARCEQLAKAAAAWTAFSEVCRDELGVEPVVVLSAQMGEELVKTLGVDELDGVKPDKAALGGWRDVFRRGLGERLGG